MEQDQQGARRLLHSLPPTDDLLAFCGLSTCAAPQPSVRVSFEAPEGASVHLCGHRYSQECCDDNNC